MKRIATVTLNPALDKTIVVHQLQVGKKNHVIDKRVDLGGNGINAAQVLSYFEMNPLAMGWLGWEADIYEQELQQEGVVTDFLRIPQRMRRIIRVMTEDKKQITEFFESGFRAGPDAESRFYQRFCEVLPHIDLVILSGSLPLKTDPSYYEQLINKAKEEGIITLLDTHGVPFQYALQARPYAVKPNQEEVTEYLGFAPESEEEWVQAGKDLLSQGIQLVVLSLGGEGALFFQSDSILRTVPPPIEVQSPVGAGDSMVAGMAISLSRGWTLKEMARFSTALGSATASKPGTALVRPEEVPGLLEQIEVREIHP